VWHDGRWVLATSPDGRWRYDGVRWRRRLGSRFDLRRANVVAFVLWCAGLLAVWIVGAVLLTLDGPDPQPSPAAGWLLALLFVLAPIATVVYGGFLATRRAWFDLRIAPLVGGAITVAGYWLAMVSSQSPGSDDGAAVGVVILGVPMLIVIALLLAVGAGAVTLTRRVGRAPRPSSPPPALGA
jgi:hypothetical protein